MVRKNSASNHIPVLKWTIFFLKIMGGYQKKLNIFSYLTIISIGILVLHVVLDLVLNWTGIDTLKRIVYLPSLTLTYVKATYLVLNTTKLERLLGMFKYFWRTNIFGDKTDKEMSKIYNRIARLWKIYTVMILHFCVTLISFPLIKFDQQILMITEFASCDIKRSFLCWLINYIWQSATLVFQCLPAVLAFDLIFMICTGYIYAGFKLLHIALKKLNTENVHVRQNMLKKIVDQHVLIMEFVNIMDTMYTGLMFLQFYCSLWSMILILYVLVANGIPPSFEDLSYYGSFYVVIAFQLLLYAISGAIIQNQVRNMDMQIFMVDWYKKDCTKLRQDLALMILRSQNARILSAGKMSDLNLELYTDIIKNSLSVFALIWQVASKK